MGKLTLRCTTGEHSISFVQCIQRVLGTILPDVSEGSICSWIPLLCACSKASYGHQDLDWWSLSAPSSTCIVSKIRFFVGGTLTTLQYRHIAKWLNHHAHYLLTWFVNPKSKMCNEARPTRRTFLTPPSLPFVHPLLQLQTPFLIMLQTEKKDVSFIDRPRNLNSFYRRRSLVGTYPVMPGKDWRM